MSLLDELKEKRQDAIENVAAEDLDIEATNLTLAEHQRVRAFWAAQIVDLDKAISALTPEGKEALLESQPEPIPTEVRKQDEQDAAGDWTNGGEDRLDAVCAELLAAPPPAQEAPAIPEGFIPWGGGEYLPVARGTPLVVLYRNGSEVDCTAGDEMSEFWHRSSTLVDHSPDHDIIAYRIIEASADAERIEDAIPEDWTRHDGGECPLRAGVDVDLRFRDGSTYFNSIGLGDFRKNWSWDCSEPAQIVAYRENQASAEAERIEDASQGTPSTEQTEHDRPKLTNEEFESLEKIDGVLDAEPSPILRSEVPPAAETYLAPSGDEFATVNGQTHLIVSDEAEAQGQAETAPQAAYAPIHNEDEPSDAAVFAHGLNVELDQKAEPKRFGIWGIEFGHAKQKADA